MLRLCGYWESKVSSAIVLDGSCTRSSIPECYSAIQGLLVWNRAIPHSYSSDQHGIRTLALRRFNFTTLQTGSWIGEDVLGCGLCG